MTPVLAEVSLVFGEEGIHWHYAEEKDVSNRKASE